MKQRVLIVDDEALCALLLSTALEAEGFEVRSATRAEQAIEVGTEFRPDVLVTDWMLRDEKDGIDIVRALRKTVPEMRVIFITGMAPEMLDRQAENVQPYSVLVKPLDVDQVVSLLSA